MTDLKKTDCTQEQAKNENNLPSRHLTDSTIVLDLESQLKEIKLEEAMQRNGHSARTLVKYPNFRIVLIAIKKGACIPKHKADGAISIQVLQGQIHLLIARHPVNLSSGHLLALDQSFPHDIEAMEDSAFLLSISTS